MPQVLIYFGGFQIMPLTMHLEINLTLTGMHMSTYTHNSSTCLGPYDKKNVSSFIHLHLETIKLSNKNSLVYNLFYLLKQKHWTIIIYFYSMPFKVYIFCVNTQDNVQVNKSVKMYHNHYIYSCLNMFIAESTNLDMHAKS